MKLKQITTGLIATAMVFTGATAAFAADNQEDTAPIESAICIAVTIAETGNGELPAGVTILQREINNNQEAIKIIPALDISNLSEEELKELKEKGNFAFKIIKSDSAIDISQLSEEELNQLKENGGLTFEITEATPTVEATKLTDEEVDELIANGELMITEVIDVK